MNVQRMRRIDRWLGTPVCFLLTRWRKLFRGATPPASEEPESILFIKLAEQGSTVLAQEALRDAVRRVGRDNVYFLLFEENRPILDLLDLIPAGNVVAIRAKGLVGAVRGALAAIWRMRKLKLGAVIDLEFFARSSAALAYLSGAPRRVGYHAFNDEAAYRGDLMTHRLSFNPYLHTSQAFGVMVAALDHPAEAFPRFDLVPAPVQYPERRFVPKPSEVAVVKEKLRAELGMAADGGLILLNANASDLMPLRKWDGGRYVELATRLLGAHPDAAIAFTGAKTEAAAVDELVRRVGSPRCGSMAGKTDFRQLVTLYGLADVLVTNDSGPAHFATLTGVDVVVLFGPETPKLFAAVSPRTFPIWEGLACSPCINAFNDRLSACRDNICMKRITVDRVFAEVTTRYGSRHMVPLPMRRAA